jgi:alpha-1,2-mannosyltransferase
MGQVNCIVASLAVAHVYLYWRGRPRLSVVALALGASIKLTPAIFIVYHLARGRIRLAIASSVLLLCLLAASFLVFGRGAPAAIAAFGQGTIGNGQGFDLSYSGNQSVRAAELRLFSQPEEASRRPYDAVSLAISFILLFGAVLAANRQKVETAAAAAMFCCMVMLSPLAWKGHYVGLLLPAAWLTARTIGAARRLDRAVACLAVATSFGLFTFTSPMLIGPRAAEWADQHSLVLVGALIAYIAALIWRGQPPADAAT